MNPMGTTSSERVHTLGSIPLFSNLTPEELAEVSALFDERLYRKGETICRAGEEGDTFYVVLSGVLEIWGGKKEEKIITRLGPRDFFGELALVVGGPRSATVRVGQRTRLLSLKKEAFNRFFLKNAKALEYFSKVICQRLASTARGGEDDTGRPITVISIVSRPGLFGRSLVAGALATLLTEHQDGEVLLMRVRLASESVSEPASMKAHTLHDAKTAKSEILSLVKPSAGPLPAQLHLVVEGESAVACGEVVATLVAKLTDRFAYLVFDLGTHQYLVDSVAEFSDRLIALVDRAGVDDYTAIASAAVDTLQVVNLHNRTSTTTHISACEPFVLPEDKRLASSDLETLAETLREAPDSPGAIPLHRLARKVLGRTVGLALGGGAAFGLAHLGVLKVFEDNGLPIDLLAGCSMGSLVAIGYCSGLRAQRLIELASELGTQKKLLALAMRDATMVQPGLLTGNGIKRTFLPFLGGKRTFEDLLMPCQVVATDIETGERVALDSGSLADSFRASCSVPLAIAPVRLDNRILVDGGVTDPCPAEVVRDMGADICIAVNVVPPMKKGVETVIAKYYRRFNAFNPFAYLTRSVDLPNMFDIAMSSMQTLQYELGNFKAISADVRINPDLSDFTWVDFPRDKELVEKGIQATERALPAIRRAITQGAA